MALMFRPSLVESETSSGSGTFGPAVFGLPAAGAAGFAAGGAGVLFGGAGVLVGGAGVFWGGVGVRTGGALVLGGAKGVFLPGGAPGGAWPKAGNVNATTKHQVTSLRLLSELPTTINRNSRPK